MSDYAVDTMAFVLWLEKRKLPRKVKSIFDSTESLQGRIYIPALVFAEIAYLAEKNRIDLTLEECKAYISKNERFRTAPMTLESITTTFNIHDISELHDRLIAAEGVIRNIPTITNDPVISASKFTRTLWR